MSFKQLLIGKVGVAGSTQSTPTISLDPSTGTITCNNIVGNVNATVNLDSINSNINTLFNITNTHTNDISNVQGDTATLFITTNSQGNTITIHNSVLNNHNDYFNDINVAFLGLDQAVENAQNDIINIQLNINTLVNADTNINLVLANAYNQANSATILAGSAYNQANSAYNQANSYLNGLTTNDLTVQNADMLFKVNFTSQPQIRFLSNGPTFPLMNIYQNFGGEEKYTWLEPAGVSITHNYPDPESTAYITMIEPNTSVAVGIHAGSITPNFVAQGGSLYLKSDGDFFTYDPVDGVWISQSLGSQVNTKHISVKDNANSNTQIELDPTNYSGIFIQTNGGLEDPSIVIDKTNTTADGITTLGSTNLTLSHTFTIEDQTSPYINLIDNTGLINSQIYYGANVPTHTLGVGNGSLFIQGGSSPNLYQYNGTAWTGVGGGGGSSIVGSYSVPVITKATMSANFNTNGTSILQIPFDTQTLKEPTGWINNVSGNQYTIPYSGIFTVSAFVNLSYGSNTYFGVYVYKNNTVLVGRDIETHSGTFTEGGIQVSITDFFNSGDLIDIRINSQAGVVGTVVSNESYFVIQGFRTDSLTNTSNIYIPALSKWTLGQTQLITANVASQLNFINPELKVPNLSWINDINGQMTVVENGIYKISASLVYNTNATLDRFGSLDIYINGVKQGGDNEFLPAGLPTPALTCQDFYQLNTGAVITIWANCTQTANCPSDLRSFYVVEKIT